MLHTALLGPALPSAVLPAAFLLALEAVVAVPVPPASPQAPFSAVDTNSCAAAARCRADADAEHDGTARVTSRLGREVATGARESALGHAGQRVALAVPPGARTARAVFVWQVHGAAVALRSAAGRSTGQVGLATWASWCGGRCVAAEDRATVLSVRTHGARPAARARGPVVVTLVARLTGPLPPTVTWQTWAYAQVSGEPSGRDGYAGGGVASVSATLVSADVTFS